ncbi:MAG: DHA2 family efflux MFS transporter permease subunit [Caulobacterales bacterium]
MSTATAAAADAGASPRSLGEGRKLAIFLIMSVGMFMALLDIQIVAASMNSIQAGLSAAQDEIDWLQTSYLMAEIVMIPLSAYLCEALSTRWMFVISAGLFTLSSLLCGVAWDLPSMVVFRAIQGFVGGAMIPMVFATGFAFFDGPKTAMVTAVLGVISTLAPTLGPTVGGWITDSFSWRWLFFINIAPGLLVTVALTMLGPIDRGEPRLLARIDWLHAAALAVSLGGLQYVLEEGPRHQWFEDRTVAAVAWTALVAGVVFIERCLFSPRPLVKIGVFRRRGFTAACILSFAIGFGLYTIVYLTPVFLGVVRGYSSLEIGSTVFIVGVFMTACAPIAAWLATVIDLRLVMLAGLILYALSFWMVSSITSDWGFWQLFWPQAVRGAAVLFCMVPSVGMAMSNVPDAELRDASGLSSLMRNLGGAVGIALVNTWLLDFYRLHLGRLSEGLGGAPGKAVAAMGQLARRFAVQGADPGHVGGMAVAVLGRGVSAQALTQAFRDVFQLTAWLFVAAILVIPFARGGTMVGDRH